MTGTRCGQPMARSCFLAPIARASRKLCSSSKARSTRARKKGGCSMCRVRRPTGRPMDDGRQWLADATAEVAGGVAHVVSMTDHTMKRLLETESRHGATRFSPDGKLGGVFIRRDRAASRSSCAPSRMASRPGEDTDLRVGGRLSGLALRRPGAVLHVRRRDHSRCGHDWTADRWACASPACPVSSMSGKRPAGPAYDGKFLGNPYDTRDGKQFIVDCTVRPSREYVVLMNWPLVQTRR